MDNGSDDDGEEVYGGAKVEGKKGEDADEEIGADAQVGQKRQREK